MILYNVIYLTTGKFLSPLCLDLSVVPANFSNHSLNNMINFSFLKIFIANC
jgi:hypothetical protein